jgi:hypothetical protein
VSITDVQEKEKIVRSLEGTTLRDRFKGLSATANEIFHENQVVHLHCGF